ncbi:hypothetical protein TWF506_007257 [Arthrobotrys conoides]|uniref:Uncharacterized protein n=1 Tax=Arthrobotrys conoides TaxID=74498 RepID=A0AAN8NA85_9PEZI
MAGAPPYSPAGLPITLYIENQPNTESSIDELSNILHNSNLETVPDYGLQSISDGNAPYFNLMNENTNTNFNMSPLDRFILSVERSENPNVCYSNIQASEYVSQHDGELSQINAESEQTLTVASTVQSNQNQSSRTIVSTACTNYD